MLSVSTLALVAWEKPLWHRLFLACVIWLPLIREDGGFYAAFAGLASWAIAEPDRRARRRRTLLTVFFGGILVSAASMVFKSYMFPGFDAFQSNFSGQSWSHLSWPFVLERAHAAVTNPNIVPVLLGCCALAFRDLRYAAGLVLLLPLFMLHLLSVRDEHGHVTLYFALPWLLPPVIWILLLARRQQMGRASLAEALTVVAFAITMTAPAQAAVGIQTNFSVQSSRGPLETHSRSGEHAKVRTQCASSLRLQRALPRPGMRVSGCRRADSQRSAPEGDR